MPHTGKSIYFYSYFQQIRGMVLRCFLVYLIIFIIFICNIAIKTVGWRGSPPLDFDSSRSKHFCSNRPWFTICHPPLRYLVKISTRKLWHTSYSLLEHCSNVSTTPITAMGCRQCLPLSVVQLKGKHCQKLHCHNGIVDMFRKFLFKNHN